MDNKFFHMALDAEREKMDIETFSTAMNEADEKFWAALLSAYRIGNDIQVGKLICAMIDDYLGGIAEAKAPEFEQRDKIDRAMDEGERRADELREEMR